MPALHEVVGPPPSPLRRVEALFRLPQEKERKFEQLEAIQIGENLIRDIDSIVTGLSEFPQEYVDFPFKPSARINFDVANMGKNVDLTHTLVDGRRVLSFIVGDDRRKKEGTIDTRRGIIRASGFSIDCNGRTHQESPLEGTPRAVQEIERVFESLVVAANGK